MGEADTEDSLGEDSHDFQISRGDTDHDCTLLTGPGKGVKSSSSGKTVAPEDPGMQGNTDLKAARDASASWAVSQLSTALGATTTSIAGSVDSGLDSSGNHPSWSVSKTQVFTNLMDKVTEAAQLLSTAYVDLAKVVQQV